MFTKKEDPKVETKNTKTNSTSPVNEAYSLAKSNSRVPSTETSCCTPSSTKESCCSSEKKNNQKTRITVKYDIGFGNQFTIRGKGANLSWDKGSPLRNTKKDEWTWETDANFSQCEFKILINDRQYETGENHTATSGANVIFTPHF